MHFLVQALLAVALLACGPWAHSATQLNIENGKLAGASGVLVNNALYDVTFASGSCDSLFNGCSAGAFAFNNLGDANAATAALSSSVFQGIYDTDFNLTKGCTGYSSCSIYTPYAKVQASNIVSFAALLNVAGPGNFLMHGRGGAWVDFSTDTYYGTTREVYAVWTAAPVPEPASYALLLGGLALMTAALRRRQGS